VENLKKNNYFGVASFAKIAPFQSFYKGIFWNRFLVVF
jgi:hypothetical protein